VIWIPLVVVALDVQSLNILHRWEQPKCGLSIVEFPQNAAGGIRDAKLHGQTIQELKTKGRA
jgi:hypothetical protein